MTSPFDSFPLPVEDEEVEELKVDSSKQNEFHQRKKFNEEDVAKQMAKHRQEERELKLEMDRVNADLKTFTRFNMSWAALSRRNRLYLLLFCLIQIALWAYHLI